MIGLSTETSIWKFVQDIANKCIVAIKMDYLMQNYQYLKKNVLNKS